LSATGSCKDGLQHCWKDRNRDKGATAEVRESSQKLHRLAVLATSPEGNSPSPDVVPPNPTMRVSGRSTVSGVFFCLRKCPQMTKRGLRFRWQSALRNHDACVSPLQSLSCTSVIVASSRTCLRHRCLGCSRRSGCIETLFGHSAHVSREHGGHVTDAPKTVCSSPSVGGPVSSRTHLSALTLNASRRCTL
jgi:hypothetical protein